MVRKVSERCLTAIEEIVRARFPEGMSAGAIAMAMNRAAPPPRTLQYHLSLLVGQKRLVRDGGRRCAHYHVSRVDQEITTAVVADGSPFPLRKVAEAHTAEAVSTASAVRYDRKFLDACYSTRSAVVGKALDQPDPFQLLYRSHVHKVVGSVVRSRMGRKTAAAHISEWMAEHIPLQDRECFQTMVEDELHSLNERGLERYQIRSSHFEAWQKIWKR